LAAGTYFPWLSRSGEDLGTLGGRSYIWSQSINFYQDRIDWIHQMFGFGSFGVAASSASTTYSATFVGKLDRDLSLKSPHSSTLELLFDGGWVIGILFAATIVYMAWVLSRRTSAIDLAGLGMLTALSFVGIGEVTLSPGHAQATWWVLLILGTIAFSRESPCQPDTMKVPVNEAMPRTVQHL
jgi:hypothetical protein